MPAEITIVDRGRGWQLSTSRITVQDLVPYFQHGDTHEEILRWMPALNAEELRVIEQFYRDNQAALDEEDRRIRERTAEAIRLQRLRFPELSPEGRGARLEEWRRRIHQERNGQGNPG